MNASKIIIILIVLAGIVTVGVKAGRWADAASRETETRFADAIRVLQDN